MTPREGLIAALLIALGCATMLGDVLGLQALKAFGLATAASPAPKVFTAQDGFETYANRFYIEWYDGTGALKQVELTPAVYARLPGPYNRRNVYGAAVSYSPVLDANPVTRPLFRSVLERSFCGDHPITEALGVPREAASHGPIRVRLKPRGKHEQPDFKMDHEVRCNGG